MFELLSQIIILVAIVFLVRYILLSFIDQKYLTWLGGIVLVLLLVLAFLDPTDTTVSALWSVLSFPLKPLGLVIILLIYALRQGVKKVEGAQVMTALLILVICSLPLTAYLLTAQTEQKSVQEVIRRQEASGELRDVQAIVTLGDGSPTDPAYRVRTQVSNAQDGISISLLSRLLYTAQLYAQQAGRGTTPLVIISAGSQPLPGTPQGNSVQRIVDILVSNGVPKEQVRVDLEGVDPRSSAVAVRKILSGQVSSTQPCQVYVNCNGNGSQPVTQPVVGPPTPIMLITPALNVRRATATFTKLNFRILPRPTDFYVFQIQRGLQLAALADLFPNAEALAITTRAIDEYLATLYYFVRGWLASPLDA